MTVLVIEAGPSGDDSLDVISKWFFSSFPCTPFGHSNCIHTDNRPRPNANFFYLSRHTLRNVF